MVNPRRFPDSELVEHNPKLDVDALYRAGALLTGQISSWTCHWLTVRIRAEQDRIWIGDQEVEIVRDRVLAEGRGRRGRFGGRGVRIKFLCPGCARGCRILHARGRTWICRLCAKYGYSSTRKDRWAPALDRLRSLRRRLALGHPLHRWGKRRLRKAMLAYER